MTYDTIDNDVTMAGRERTLLGGRLAYECLKGEPPFVRGAIEDQIKNKIPEPPVGRDDPSAPLEDGIMAGLAEKEGYFSHKVHKGRGVAVVLSLLAALCIGGWWFAKSPSSHGIREGKEYTRPKHGDVKTLTLPGGATMEMIYVGPGTFTMGSPPSEEGRDDDETQHRVTLTKGFWLGKYEVTQNQWQSVMGSNPSFFKGDANLPVENVSWDDCQEFVRKVSDAARRQFGGGARLPTEAEWEYACRAEMSGAYAGTGRLDDMGWYSGNSGDKTHPVGQKRANGWGFYDMHGNVWEWCQDWYGDYDSNATDPSGPASGDYRALRGGSWGSLARFCRSADRDGDDPGYRCSCYGFRLSCSALP